MTLTEHQQPRRRNFSEYLSDLLAKVKKKPKEDILEPLVLTPDHPYYNYQQIINGIVALLEQSIEGISFAVSNDSSVNFSNWSSENRPHSAGFRENEYVITCTATLGEQPYRVKIEKRDRRGWKGHVLKGDDFTELMIVIEDNLNDWFSLELTFQKSVASGQLIFLAKDQVDEKNGMNLSPSENSELLNRLVHPIRVFVNRYLSGNSTNRTPQENTGKSGLPLLE